MAVRRSLSDRATSRAPSWAASVATGLASGVHGPSAAWLSALSALAASSGSGCEADSAGSLTTTRGRTVGARWSDPRARRWMRVISAPDSVVGTAIATCVPPEAAASALAVSTTRPPPSATMRSRATAPRRSPASSST